MSLALRNIFRHRIRTLLTIAAIVFGVAGIILTGGFVQDIFLKLREATIHSQLGHLQVYKAGYYEQGRRNPYDFVFEPPQQLDWPDTVRTEIKEILMRLNFSGLISSGNAERPVIAEGVEPDKEARLGTFVTITDGRHLANEDIYGIVVGEGIAKVLRLEPGDLVTLTSNTTDGSLNSLEFEVVGIFRSFSRDYDDRAVRISLPMARELLAANGVHSLVLLLKDTHVTDEVANQLRSTLPGDAFEVKTWYELAPFFRKTVDLYERQFGVLQLIILIMVILSVANSVNMSIHERTGEFGTLLALGNRRRRVFWLIIVENTLLGFIGAGLGAGIGMILAWGISSVGIPMPPPPNSNSGYIAHIQIVPSIVTMALMIGATATIIAAFLPARKVARLSIAEALRHNK